MFFAHRLIAENQIILNAEYYLNSRFIRPSEVEDELILPSGTYTLNLLPISVAILLNALSPILVTDSGICIDSK